MAEREAVILVKVVSKRFGNCIATVSGHMITFNEETAPVIRIGESLRIREIGGLMITKIRIKGRFLNLEHTYDFEELGPA